MDSAHSSMKSTTGVKPLPLKQRTSSVDARRDYSTSTFTSLVSLLKVREWFFTVDGFSIWRRHLAWSFSDGKDLRDYMTQRYASCMVFMSLLLSIELNVLFNSAGVTTEVRRALMEEQHATVSFWTGIAVILSAVLTLLSLISTFTAWSMVSSISEANAHCIFRSSIGQYAAELPGRFIVGSIYSFLIWLIMFFFLLLPLGIWSILLMVIGIVLFVHVIATFSAFGRILMHTGAMGENPIFEHTYETTCSPRALHNNLLIKAKANLTNKTSIRRQYQSKRQPINRVFSSEELSQHLSDRTLPGDSMGDTTVADQNERVRKRTESLVKFADGYDTQGDRVVATPRNIDVVVPRGAKTPMSAMSNNSLSPRHRLPKRPQPVVPKRPAEVDTTPFVYNKSRVASSAVADKWLNVSTDSGMAGDDGPPPPPPPPADIEVGVQDYRIPIQVSHSRASSAASSLEGARFHVNANEKVSDEDFERLFDPELSFSDDGDDGDRNIAGGAANSHAERTGLLKDDAMKRGNYSSFH